MGGVVGYGLADGRVTPGDGEGLAKWVAAERVGGVDAAVGVFNAAGLQLVTIAPGELGLLVLGVGLACDVAVFVVAPGGDLVKRVGLFDFPAKVVEDDGGLLFERGAGKVAGGG